jgi:hypothetical protein
MKKFLLLITVNLLIFLALIILSELLVRLFFPQIQITGTDRTFIKDSVYYSSPGLSPNSKGMSNSYLKKVDNSGFWKYSKTNNNKKRILYLGDSVTMGIGAESDSTFAGIINNDEENKILNSSLIGYSSFDYLDIIKKLIPEEKNNLKVSKVLLFWCLNDVYDYYPEVSTPEVKPDGIFGEAFYFFKNNFKLFYFLKDSFTDRPKSYYLYDEKFYKPDNKFFKESLKNLIAISEILKDEHIDFEIFLLPYEYQLRDEVKTETGPQKLLADSLSNYGIKAHDLSSTLKKYNSTEELYLYGDGIHFSNKGHRIIASYIKDICR